MLAGNVLSKGTSRQQIAYQYHSQPKSETTKSDLQSVPFSHYGDNLVMLFMQLARQRIGPGLSLQCPLALCAEMALKGRYRLRVSLHACSTG